MNLSDMIKSMFRLRHKQPERFNEFKNVVGSYTVVDIIIKIPNQKIYYADQSNSGSSKEATLVREGTWKSDEVGWLWWEVPSFVYDFFIRISKGRKWLARISPEGISTFVKGEINQEEKTMTINI